MAKAIDTQTAKTVRNKKKYSTSKHLELKNEEIFGNIMNDLLLLKRHDHIKEVLKPFKFIKSKQLGLHILDKTSNRPLLLPR